MRSTIKIFLALILSFTLTEAPFCKAHAAMISTQEVVSKIERQETEQKVIVFLDRKDVKAELIRLGVKPSEASIRVASLSDEELNQLNSEIDQSLAAGDVGVIGILVVVLLVILIIYFAKRV